jgi:hypothetical protein
MEKSGSLVLRQFLTGVLRSTLNIKNLKEIGGFKQLISDNRNGPILRIISLYYSQV